MADRDAAHAPHLVKLKPTPSPSFLTFNGCAVAEQDSVQLQPFSQVSCLISSLLSPKTGSAALLLLPQVPVSWSIPS